MKKSIWLLGLFLLITVNVWCAGYYTQFTESWYKSPLELNLGDTSENLYIGDVAVDPVTGYVLVLNGAKYGGTVSTWSTLVNPNDQVTISVLNPDTGDLVGRIANIPFNGGWGVSPTRLTVTDDGVVMILGYEGGFLTIPTATTWNASGAIKVGGGGYYRPEDGTPLYGGSFGISAIGNYKEGRCYVFSHRGNTFYVLKNNPGNKDYFGVLRYGAVAYGTTSNTSDLIQGIEATHDLKTVYTYRGSNLGVRKFVGEPAGGYTRNTSVSYTFSWEGSMDADIDNNLIVTAGLHNDNSGDTTKDYIRVCFQNLQGQAVGTGTNGAGVYVKSNVPRINSELRVGVAVDTVRGNVYVASNCGVIKYTGTRTLLPSTTVNELVVIPKPQSMIRLTGSLSLDKTLLPEAHYTDVSTRVERAARSACRYLSPTIQTAAKIPVFLAVAGYDSQVSQKCLDEGITVPTQTNGYALSISSTGVTIVGRDIVGLFYGLMSLRQLKQDTTNSYLPYVKIEDYPKLAYRGVHTFTGKNALLEQKRLIDLLASYKMNQIVLQLDYMEFKSHPEMWYSPWGQSQSDVKNLIEYANDRFIEVSPLVNGPGHAEWMFRTGYHWELSEDTTPDAGRIPYAYCITNETTYHILFDIYDEVVDLFKPKYFHIGHDEPNTASYVEFPEVSVGYTVRQLLEMDHAKVAQYFANKNIDLMFWGDMLLYKTESRDGAALALNYDDATGMRANLKQIENNTGYPKYYICDWHYGAYPPSDYGSVTVLHNSGYPTIPSTWYDHDNIRNFTLQAIDKGSVGLLQTTWAGFNFRIEANTGSYYQFEAYVLAADYSWSGRNDYIVGIGYSPKTTFWNKWNKLKAGTETVLDASQTPVVDWALMEE